MSLATSFLVVRLEKHALVGPGIAENQEHFLV